MQSTRPAKDKRTVAPFLMTAHSRTIVTRHSLYTDRKIGLSERIIIFNAFLNPLISRGAPSAFGTSEHVNFILCSDRNKSWEDADLWPQWAFATEQPKNILPRASSWFLSAPGCQLFSPWLTTETAILQSLPLQSASTRRSLFLWLQWALAHYPNLH